MRGSGDSAAGHADLAHHRLELGRPDCLRIRADARDRPLEAVRVDVEPFMPAGDVR